jgi:hypothetical protein
MVVIKALLENCLIHNDIAGLGAIRPDYEIFLSTESVRNPY